MKKKRIAIMAVCLGLGFGAVAGSYAWLTAKADPITNTFTSSRNITIEVEENFDEVKAKTYLPASEITKEAKVNNTSADVAAYAGIKVEFQVTEKGNVKTISRDEFEAKYAKLDTIDTTRWTRIDDGNSNSELYMFNTPVAAQGSTDNLFTKVTVNEDIELVDGKLPSFNVVVSGYATQSEGSTVAKAKASLISLAGL